MKKVLIWILFFSLFPLTLIDSAEAKRPKPKKVPTAEYKQIKYTATQAPSQSHTQQGGYIEAWNQKTNQRIWELKIYDNKFDPGLPREDQEVYITSLKMDGALLIVANEIGDEFQVNIDARQVTKRTTPSKPSTQQPSKTSVLVR